ncbi:MAG: alpha/beta hydrolase [Undibacterium sp.]|nr:alpha/beta hydrolase [Undibacterium sp.]
MTTKPQLHFIHGNSFPAGTYTQMFAYLQPHYDIQALDMHGHNPAYPVTEDWPNLVQEVIDTLAAKYHEPVILLGHSLGGLLALMAASQRPDLVRCVLMIDSPVISGWRAWFLKGMKLFGQLKKFSPAQFSERRRTLWRSKEEALAHFASKENFSLWSPDALRDYIEHGMLPHKDGIQLKFNREIETAIYMTLPSNLGRLVSKGWKVPIGFVGGTDSFECKQGGLASTRKIVAENFVQIKAGHLLPMEMPKETAEAVHHMLRKLTKINCSQ